MLLAFTPVSMAAPFQPIPRDTQPSLAETYNDYFLLGNIYRNHQDFTDATRRNLLNYNYNVISGENFHKPDNVSSGGANTDPVAHGGNGTYRWTFTNGDTMMDNAAANNQLVAGHVLAWHSQSPAWLNGGAGTLPGTYTRARARANLEFFIQNVVEHFDQWKLEDGSNRLISWDVVNEAFTDGVTWPADAPAGQWKNHLRAASQSGWIRAYSNGMNVAAGEHPSDFIYDAFVFARRYTEAKLIYNDFNLYFDGKASAIAQMVQELNAKYAEEYPDDPRLLIETVGFQSHNYMWDTPASAVDRNIQRFLDLGVNVAMTELDLFCFAPWNGEPQGTNGTFIELKNRTEAQLVANTTNTAQRYYWRDLGITTGAEVEVAQAIRYAEFFMVYMKYADRIDRVTFWGLRDTDSWRRNHNPLLFNVDYSPKDSFWAVADPLGYLGIIPDPEVSITGPASIVNGPEAMAEYTISGWNLPNVSGIELEFEIDGSFLGAKDVIPIDFDIIGNGNYGSAIYWRNDGDAWIGKITLVNPDGVSGDRDLLKLIFDAKAGVLGETEIKLLYVLMSYEGEIVPVAIGDGMVATVFEKYYVPWDLNKDDVVDLNDITFALQFFGAAEGDADWDIAKAADINIDGKVGVDDLLLILANYTVPYYK